MATKVVVPQLGESVVEATVGTWLKAEGDSIAIGDVLVELQTDKVDVEVGAETAGVLAKIEAPEGEDVEIGDVLAVIEDNGAALAGETTPAKTSDEPQAQLAEVTPVEQPPATDGQRESSERVTPVARRIATEQGIDLSQVSGSGPSGRITKQDVQDYQQKTETKAPTTEPLSLPATEQETPTELHPAAGPPLRHEERQRMTRRRRTIAARLVEAQHTAAILTTFNEIDMSAVITMRKRRQEQFVQRHGVKLGFMSFFVKASIGALKAFPRLNAEIQEEDIVLKHYYDIGMAVGVEDGLVVPVLRDADRMSFAEIEQTIKDLAQKAQEGSLTLADLRGGTFTITNGGVFGSMLSTPILNPPQVGILGLHNIQDRPVAENGQVVIRPIMYVALTYDHRIVDGKSAVTFLKTIIDLLEDPASMLLGL
jgi:2-oxoglutarate dehydrogenase E2 component (dihydrolipoamide succinyltransferase)